MFTGLVAATGTVRMVERSEDGVRLDVESRLGADLERGESVAVNGVCLTAVDVARGGFSADVMAETLERSALGAVARGARVNLELPLRAVDRLGGHIVQGHVDGVGTVTSLGEEGFARRVSVRADADVCRYVVGRGSVALDGVSLTALDAGDEGFAVALIPETLERTTLGGLTPGDRVNIEVDVLAKYVEKLMTVTAPADAVEAGVRR